MTQLRTLGVRLAIDDFGFGYSALAYLHRFPADILKIDTAFVDGLDADDGRRDLTEAVVQVGQALGMLIVAEGVERDTQLAKLREMGCDLAQGYRLARPMNPTAIGRLLGRGIQDIKDARSVASADVDDGLPTSDAPAA